MMAFILFIIGGIAGVVALLTSIIAFDANAFAALSAFFATGMVVALAGLALALVPYMSTRYSRMIQA